MKTGGFRRACLRALTMFVAIASPAYAQRAPSPAIDGRPTAPVTNSVDRERATAALSKLPIRFEPTDQKGTFLARGMGPAVRLTGRSIEFPTGSGSEGRNSIRVEFTGGRRSSRVSGVDPLPGRINYLDIHNPARSRTNVRTYARAHTHDLYRGIDVDYYGADDLLEYDFIVQPGARPDAIRLTISGAPVAIDASGDLIYGDSHRVLLRKPVAYQTIDGVRHDVTVAYRKHHNSVGFALGAFDRERPLIIDPVVAYSFGFGGSGYEYASDIAVDGRGAIYVGGSTFSSDFPTVNPAQASGPGGQCWFPGTEFFPCWSGFLARLAPDGATLEYATYFSLSSSSGIGRIAVDANGATYFVGGARAYGSSTSSSFIAKLAPDGSRFVYTFVTPDSLGDLTVGSDGSVYVIKSGGVATLSANGDNYHSILSLPGTSLSAIVASHGNLFLTGTTSWAGFQATAGAVQTSFAGHWIWSTQDGLSFTPSDHGLEDWFGIQGVVVSPVDARVRYALSGSRFARSLDGGQNWTPVSVPTTQSVRIVADTLDRLTAYIISGDAPSGFWKTTDAGTTLAPLPNPSVIVKSLLVGPRDGTLYLTDYFFENTRHNYKSTDGGSTWTLMPLLTTPLLYVDSSVPARLYAKAGDWFFRTADEGNSTDMNIPGVPLAAAPSDPRIVYVAQGNSLIKTADDGVTWDAVLDGPWVTWAAVHPTAPDTILVQSGTSIFRSIDGGKDWITLQHAGLSSATLDPADPSLVLVTEETATRDGVLLRLTADGAIVSASYLGGSGDDVLVDLAVDSEGAVYVVGTTSSADFPQGRYEVPWNLASPDRFVVAKLTSDGGNIRYAAILSYPANTSPYRFNDAPWVVRVDGGGNAYTVACVPNTANVCSFITSDCQSWRIDSAGEISQITANVPSRLFTVDPSGDQYFADYSQRCWDVTITKYSGTGLRSVTVNGPSAVRFATPSSWTASVVPSGPIEYAFWRYDGSRSERIQVQGFGPSASYVWTPASWDTGYHILTVLARLAGSGLSSVSATFEFTVDGVSSGEPAIMPVAADFNSDRRPDLIWVSSATGQMAMWNVGGGAHGEQVLSGGYLAGAALPAGWRVAGSADIDGDTHTDLFLQSDTGLLGAWFFDGSTLQNGIGLMPGQVGDPNWKIRAVGDVNHDGHPDLIWQYAPTGQVAFWLMNGTTATGYIVPNVAAPGGDWEIVGTGDSNRDGERDIFWQQRSTGTLAVWWMNGTLIAGASLMSASPDPKWRVVAVADVDGDAYSDVVFQHADNHMTAVWYLQDATVRFGMMLMPSTVGDPAWRIAGPR